MEAQWKGKCSVTITNPKKMIGLRPRAARPPGTPNQHVSLGGFTRVGVPVLRCG